MKKRLSLALAAGALVAAMVPGVASAAQPSSWLAIGFDSGAGGIEFCGDPVGVLDPRSMYSIVELTLSSCQAVVIQPVR